MRTPDFARVFDETPAPLLLLSPDLVIVHANRARLEATGTTLEETVGRGLFDVFPMNPDDPEADGLRNLAESLERVRRTKQPHTMLIQKYDLRRPDGTFEERYWSPRNVPVLDDDGEVAYLLHRSDDITDYIREVDAARHARSGSGDPGSAGSGSVPGPGASGAESDDLRRRMHEAEADLLARTRELEAANVRLRAMSRRDRRMARWLSALAQAATDLAQVETLARLLEMLAEHGRRAAGAATVLLAVRDDDRLDVFGARTGGAAASTRQEVAVSSPEPIAAAARGERVLIGDRAGLLSRWPELQRPERAVRDLAACVAYPLHAGPRLIGSVLLGWTDPTAFEGTDVSLLHAFATQCAQALERVQRLEAERGTAAATRTVAETLQRSLLTEPPRPDHGQIVTRYTPASRTAKIGGDWYDAFLQRDGATVLVIGDVTGHDTFATASMGQLRSILRGVAVTTGGGPASILTDVDHAIRTLQADVLATALVARFEQTPDERRRGVTRMRWSSAGHPPPVVVAPDGTVQALARQHNGLLLGVVPETPRPEREITLERGATVLLYTDGLVERRDQDLDESIDTLLRTVRSVADRDPDLDTLCDDVLRQMLPEHPEDDVAVIAIRLHRQDRPRPAEAGPNDVPPDVPDEPGVA